MKQILEKSALWDSSTPEEFDQAYKELGAALSVETYYPKEVEESEEPEL